MTARTTSLPESRSRRDGRAIAPRWATRLAPYLLISLVAVLYVVTTVRMHGLDLSAYDEWQYMGYLYGLPGHPVVVRGDYVGVQANELLSCYGADPFGPTGVPCGGDYTNWSAYPQGGLSATDGYTPLYFWITWAIGSALQALTGVHFVIAMRLTGIAWLLPTAWLMFATLVRARTPRPFALALVLLFIVMPFSWWSYTYVSTDATVPLFGVLALLVVVRHLSGRGSLWWLVPIALVGAALKVTAIFAPLFAALALFIHWAAGAWTRRNRTAPGVPVQLGRRLRFGAAAIPAVAGIAAFLAVTLGWIAIKGALAAGPGPDQGITLGRDKYFVALIESIPSMLGGFPGIGTEIYRVDHWIVVVIGWLLAAGVIGAAVRRQRRLMDRSLAWATAIAAVAFMPLLFVLTIVQGSPFLLPARYAAALIPAALLSVALVADTKSGRITLSGLAAIVVVAQLVNAPNIA